MLGVVHAQGVAVSRQGARVRAAQPAPSGQMSTSQFFNELGAIQTTFSKPAPADNASCEAWMATIKCEQLLPGRMQLAPAPATQNLPGNPSAFDHSLTPSRCGRYTPGRKVSNDRGSTDSETAQEAEHPGPLEDRPGGCSQRRQGGRGTAPLWGIDSSQLARIREQVRTGALAELNKVQSAYGRLETLSFS